MDRKLTNVEMYLVVKNLVHLTFSAEPDEATIKAAPLKPKSSMEAMYKFNELILAKEMTSAEQHRLLRLGFIEPTSSHIVEQKIYDKLIERLSGTYPDELAMLMAGEEIVPPSVVKDKTPEQLIKELMELYPEQFAEMVATSQQG